MRRVLSQSSPGEMEPVFQAMLENAVHMDRAVVTGSPLAIVHRELIAALAMRHKLPAIYFERFFVMGGGVRMALLLLSSTGRRPGTSTAAERREARRPSSAGAHEVRAGDQSQDREGARPHFLTQNACARRRGDRVKVLRVAVHCSGIGTKRRTAASHQFGRYQRHSGHAANSSGASIRCF